jgi:Flp pilus assembly protein TadD/predicted aspartyl protease
MRAINPLACAILFFHTVSLAQTTDLTEADSLYQNREFAKAAAIYRAAAALNPLDIRAQHSLIVVLRKDDQIQEALKSAEAALKVLPDQCSLLTDLGDVHYRQGDITAARQDYTQAGKTNPNCARAFLGLGVILRMESRWKTAKRFLAQAFELDPNDPDIVLNSAYGLEPAEEKRKRYERYLAMKSPDSEGKIAAIQSRAQLLASIGGKKTFVLENKQSGARVPLEPIFPTPKKLRGLSIRVGFNGGKSWPLLLDTGASGIVVHPKVAEKAGIERLAGSRVLGIGDNGARDSYEGLAQSVEIGDLRFKDCPITVTSKKYDGDVEGIIGPDVLSRFQVRINFPGRTLELSPLPKLEGVSEEDERTQNFDATIVPLRDSFRRVLQSGHHLLIDTSVNSLRGKHFVLDTGSSVNLISTQLARAASNVGRQNYVTLRGLSGTVKDLQSADKLILEFAGFRQENRDMLAFDMTQMNKEMGFEVSGLLGFTIWQNFVLTIDYRDGLLKFEYVPPPGR